jgi:hypothetical protein
MNPTPDQTGEEQRADGTPEAERRVLGGASVARRRGAAGDAVGVVDESRDVSAIPGPRGDPTDVPTGGEAAPAAAALSGALAEGG